MKMKDTNDDLVMTMAPHFNWVNQVFPIYKELKYFLYILDHSCTDGGQCSWAVGLDVNCCKGL